MMTKEKMIELLEYWASSPSFSSDVRINAMRLLAELKGWIEPTINVRQHSTLTGPR